SGTVAAGSTDGAAVDDVEELEDVDDASGAAVATEEVDETSGVGDGCSTGAIEATSAEAGTAAAATAAAMNISVDAIASAPLIDVLRCPIVSSCRPLRSAFGGATRVPRGRNILGSSRRISPTVFVTQGRTCRNGE